MNKCKRIRDLISSYIEGELFQDNKKQFENHLGECPNCSETVTGTKNLRKNLSNLKLLKTSPDFDTVLRTRIRIESGIGRRRLNEIIWSWPAKIPVYGGALALIIIAFVLVVEQVNQSPNSIKPDPYINTQTYGGNIDQNKSPIVFDEGENYIYIIERTSPENILNGEGTFLTDSSKDTVSKKTDDNPIKRMANLLRNGAALTDLSCPACSSPLFRLKDGTLWCGKCEKKVIVVKEGEEQEKASNATYDKLEATLLTKVQEIQDKINKTEDIEELQKLSTALSEILGNLEKIKQMKKA